METKIVIAGSRKYNNYGEAKVYLTSCITEIAQNSTVVILSGGCKGADMLGETFARDMGLEIKKFPAQWQKYGKGAGPIRNRIMAEAADIIICFWDGKSSGTRSMIDLGQKIGKDVRVKLIEIQDNVISRTDHMNM